MSRAIRGQGWPAPTGATIPVAVLLLVTLLAGCLGSGGETGGNLSPGSADGPPEGASANATSDPDPTSEKATRWVQEYWGEQQEITLVDGTGQVWTGYSASSDGGGTGACLMPCEAAFFRPESEAIVAPGTERLEVTVSWSEPPGLQIDLFYEPASGEDMPPFNDVPNGEPFTIPVDDPKRDAALQPASLWWFNLWPSSDPAGAVPPSDVQLTVVAERNATLPEIGPAPKRGNASGDATLVDEATLTYRAGVHPTPGCMGVFVSCHPPDPGAWWTSRTGELVREDATTVRASLSWSRPLPVRPELEAIHVGGRVRMEVVEDDPTQMQRTYETSVPEEAVDSPWQQRSLWRFSPVFETQGQEAGVSGGEFTLTATAIHGNGTQAP